MNTKATNIEIFLPTGNPKGIKKARVTRDKIEVIQCSKKDFLENEGLLDFLGIYILVDSPESSNPSVYIGKGRVQERIKSHKDSKDFWNTIFAVQLKTEHGFNDSQLSFMEHYFINKAKETERCNAEENKQTPKKPNLDDSILCDIYHYLDICQTLLATLGLKIFQPTSKVVENQSNTDESKTENTIFYLNISKKHIEAKGIFTEEGFILLKGSVITTYESDLLKTSSKRAFNARREMLESGVLVINPKNEDTHILTKDYVCGAPSLASAIVFGRNSNGWTEWKDKDGKTLDEYYRQ